ncbi:MAG: chemotaxis protein CheW [Verrucomicrobiota bacterium]
MSTVEEDVPINEPGINIQEYSGKYLTFVLGEESFGVAVIKVREIIRMQEVTEVPQMPAHIKGVINLRGKIIPIVDLRIKFNLEMQELTNKACIIVVQVLSKEGSASQMGIIVNAVEEVTNISGEAIEEAPSFGNQLDQNYILAIAKIKDKVKTLLDIDTILEPEDLVGQSSAFMDF